MMYHQHMQRRGECRIHTPHNVATGEGEDQGAAPDTVVIQSAGALPTKSSSGQERHIRLILAFGREEPGCNAGQDNDDEANEYAPAKQSKQSATITP